MSYSGASQNSRDDQIELLGLLLERKRRQDRDDSLGSYAGFVSEFSEEPAPARHHQYLIQKMDDLNKGIIKRLMVFMPPGSAKTTYANLLYSPHWVATNPGKLMICASHTGDLAERFGRKVRNLVAADAYKRLFNVELKDDSKAAGRWETTNKAEYYAVGVRGSVTGRRGDFGLIDDPVKGRKEAESETIQNDIYEWYLADFRTRLKPKAAIALFMTRWVDYDLAGRILPVDYDGRSGPVIARDGEVWEVINLPQEAIDHDVLGRKRGELLWPEWFTPAWVEQEKRTLGPRNWNSLHQQNPTPDSGEYYRREDFRWYDKQPKHLTYYLAGDYAVSEDEGDYTEIGVFAVDPDDNIYIVDWFKGQTDALVWVDGLLDLVHRYKPVVNIGETGVIRRAVEPILKRRMRERKDYVKLEWMVHSEGNKPAMGRSFQALVQQERVYLPTNKDWAEPLLNHLTRFPNGAYDDGADACALFGRYIDRVWSKKKPVPKKKAGKVLIKPMTMEDFYDSDE